MAPKSKDAAQVGSVVKHQNLWRVIVKLGGIHRGPSRKTKDEAAADLAAMRALPRDQMRDFLQRLRDVGRVGSGSDSRPPRGSRSRSPHVPELVVPVQVLNLVDVVTPGVLPQFPLHQPPQSSSRRPDKIDWR